MATVYTPRRIKCCATCLFLKNPEKTEHRSLTLTDKKNGEEFTIEGEYGNFFQHLGCYTCEKGKYWFSSDIAEEIERGYREDSPIWITRCSQHKFKDKSLIK